MLKTRVGDEGDPGTLPLEKGVRGHGGPVQEQRVGSSPDQVTDTDTDSLTLIRGRGEFAGGERLSVPPNQIGKCAAYVDPEGHLNIPIRPFATQTHRKTPGRGDKKGVVISIEGTPNPNAVKFSVGRPVGGPATFTPGKPTDNVMAQELIALDGVTSVFLTADFVTVSKRPDADWSDIVPAAKAILEEHFV